MSDDVFFFDMLGWIRVHFRLYRMSWIVDCFVRIRYKCRVQRMEMAMKTTMLTTMVTPLQTYVQPKLMSLFEILDKSVLNMYRLMLILQPSYTHIDIISIMNYI